MRNTLKLAVCLCLIAAGSLACNPKSDEPKPSGLKNMAPPSIQEALQEGLDVEPNNTFLQATDISLTNDAMQWSGNLTPGDIDIWRIKAKAGTVADIEVIPDGDYNIIADFAASASEQERYYYDVQGAGKSEHLPNIRLTPQGIFLTVRGHLKEDSEPQQYRITIRRIETYDENSITAGEINNTRESATVVTNANQVKGTLYPAGDVDYYRIPLSAPGSLSFSTPDAAVEIAIESRDKVIWSSISNHPQLVKSDILTPDLQDVYVRIKSLEDIREAKPYQFSLALLEKVPDEIEPNNTIDKAQTIQGETQTLEFSLLDDADVDIFKVVLDPNRLYSVRLTGPQPGQAKLQGLTADGNVRTDALAEDMVICDTAVTQPDALWLKVLPGTAPWPLNYRIAIDALDADKVEKEPNQSPEQATVIQAGSTMYGHIFPAGDVDLYRIELPEYPTVEGPVGTLKVDIAGGYVAQLQLKLQDSAGYEISQLNNEQYSKPMHLAFDAPNGIYHLAVSGTGDNCLKPYALTVTFEPNEAAIASLTAQPAPNAQQPAPNAQQPAPNAQQPAPNPQQPAPNTQPQPEKAADIPIDALIEAAQKPTPSDKPAPAEDEDAF